MMVRKLSAMLMLGMFCGCAYQPYVHIDTWLMRDNAVPQYFAKYDIFFLHRAGFDWELHDTRLVALYDSLKMKVKEPFGRKARVFAPLLHDDVAVDEAELALKYYLDTFHDPGRPYAIFVEGRNENFVSNFVDECSSLMKRENGFAYFISNTNETIVATKEFVDMVERRVADLEYERQWHRPHMPEDLSKAIDLETLAELPLEVLTEDAPSMRDSFKRVPLAYRSSSRATNVVEKSTNATVEATSERKESKKRNGKSLNTFEMTLEDITGLQDKRETDETTKNTPQKVDPPGAKSAEPVIVPPINLEPISTDPRPSVKDGIRAEPAKPLVLEDIFHAGSPEVQLQSSDPVDL